MRPDWGSNPPVFVYTEEEIRAVLDEHDPGVDYDVGVRCMGVHCTQDWTTDHIIDELKKHRMEKIS